MALDIRLKRVNKIYSEGVSIVSMFWPLDSVPGIMRTIFYMAPLSLPIESIRYIITRGWSIHYFDVQVGYAVSGVYNIVLFVATVFIFHLSSSE